MAKLFKALSFLILVIIVSCSDDDKSTNPTNEESEHYYPLKVGNTWTYSTPNGNQTFTIDKTVTASNGKTAYHIDGDDDYTFGARHLYYDGTKLYGYENEDPIMIFDEATFQSNSVELTVPAGTYNTVVFDWGNGTSVKRYWYASGIGVVQAELHETIRQLSSYSFQ